MSSQNPANDQDRPIKGAIDEYRSRMATKFEEDLPPTAPASTRAPKLAELNSVCSGVRGKLWTALGRIHNSLESGAHGGDDSVGPLENVQRTLP
jgi:hypothetical protein